MCDKESDLKHKEAKKRNVHDHKHQNQHVNLNERQIQNENQNEVAAAGPSNIESSSGIFKIDIDCFEELFDYLSLDDLRTLRRTCKRFKKIIDYYIRTNYPVLGKFELNDKNFDMFRQMDAGTIGLINEIQVSVGSDFDGTKFSAIKEILNEIKKITVTKWNIKSDFYNCFLKYCKNVKYLSMKKVNSWDPPINIGDEWLNHQYPSIEYICFELVSKDKIDELMILFHLNPNIHASLVELNFLEEFAMNLIAADRKLDRLYIDVLTIKENLLDLLKKLYDAGFYKRLCLSTAFMDDLENVENYLKFTSIGIEVLSTKFLDVKIPPSPSLKEINIDCDKFVENYESVKNVFERFSCNIILFEDISAYIGNFPKLKHFKVNLPKGILVPNELNLIALNKERQKLAGACKTTIYVHDDAFLATKWATTKTNFDLIELKRVHACDWDKFFENDCGICGP